MSETGTPIERILHQAIRFEEDAHSFYTSAIDMVERSHIKDTLRDLAGEEIKHKNRLQELLAGNTEAIIGARKQRQITDLKLAEYLVAQPLDKDATFQDVLIVAMHREKSSHEFYTTMAGISEGGAAKSLFQFLAGEELMHKNKVETLYDEVMYQEM